MCIDLNKTSITFQFPTINLGCPRTISQAPIPLRGIIWIVSVICSPSFWGYRQVFVEQFVLMHSKYYITKLSSSIILPAIPLYHSLPRRRSQMTVQGSLRGTLAAKWSDFSIFCKFPKCPGFQSHQGIQFVDYCPFHVLLTKESLN